MNFFQDVPNYGFTGSTDGVLPTTLDQINPAYYNQIAAFIQKNGGRLASVCGLVIYDTLRVDAGVFPLGEFNFFSNGYGAQQGLFVAGTQYRKQDIDVSNWINRNGEFSSGYEGLFWGIGVMVSTCASLDETTQTSGNFINLPLDPGIISGEAATDAIKQGNLFRALRQSMYYELFVNNTTFEHGPMWRFPSGPFGMPASIALAGIAAAPVGDGTLANGSEFWCYQMPVLRHIPEQTKFGVKQKCQNPMTTANVGPLQITVFLEGIGVQPGTA